MPRPVDRRSTLLLFGSALASAGGLGAAGPAAARARSGRQAGVQVGIDDLVERLTLDEKISLLHGAEDPGSLGQAGYVPSVPRLGIPALRLADGPAGVRVSEPATALPAPIALACTFDTGLARRYGKVIGHEGRALGQDVLLSPMCNLIRVPYSGRNFETFSEDPLLTADLVAAEITGIQGEGLIATVKHLAMNNQEQDRMSVNVRADEQTLRETELRAFAAAVAAGSGAVMSAYNKVNGDYCGENAYLLDDVLRQAWDFTGFTMSDWYGTHSGAKSLEAGLDVEMPNGTHHGASLKTGATLGLVPVDLVDRAVRRVLTTLDAFGLLGGEPPRRPDRDRAAGARTAYDVAVGGAVLLHNPRGVLPLDRRRLHRLAVVGATARRPFVSGGGSAHVVPEHAAAPLDVLRERLGPDRVEFALGENLWGAEIPEFAGERRVPAGETKGYEATLAAGADETWNFVIHYTAEADQRPTVHLDGTELFPAAPGLGELLSGGYANLTDGGLNVRRAEIEVSAGEHRLTVTAKGGDQGQTFQLRRNTPATIADDVAGAVAAARDAEAVLLFAYEDATEGADRPSIALPGRQDALIEAVCRANENTVVVLNTSSSTAMPWLAGTGAVLQMWYPGQEGGRATTDLVLGDAAPSGRLTQTFPVSDDIHPVAGDPLAYPGVNGETEYREGLDVGYRWYAAGAAGERPSLFPFGHGLTYTAFDYGELALAATGGELTASFAVRNTGDRDGTEIPQLYVGPASRSALRQPSFALAGYARVSLAPGESRTVTITLDRRALSSWDVAAGRWTVPRGTRAVWVGASATDLRLSGEVTVPNGLAPAE
jgi:beta-glucosidase